MIRLSLLAAGLTLLTTGLTHAAAPPAAGYTNPVTAGYSADFPDPSMIKGRDGWWYAYSTGGPYAKDGHDGDSYKIARSRDLTHWEKVGSVFGADNRPHLGRPDQWLLGAGHSLPEREVRPVLHRPQHHYDAGQLGLRDRRGDRTDSGRSMD